MSKLGSFRPQLRRLLVVEDDAEIRQSVKEVLEMFVPGLVVDVAADGEDGVRALGGQQYDLVMSDFQMPGMDGLAFLARARQLQPHAPRILITAYPHLSVAQKAIDDAAISNFLTKPIGPDVLLDAVNAAVVKSRKPEWAAAGAGKAPADAKVPLRSLGPESATDRRHV